MSTLIVLIVALVAVFVAVAIAYVPMRIILQTMANSIAAPVRAFIQRQRERRALDRGSPDRRQ